MPRSISSEVILKPTRNTHTIPTRNVCVNCGEAAPHRCQGTYTQCNICEKIGHLPSHCRKAKRGGQNEAPAPVNTRRNDTAPSTQTSGASTAQSFNMPAARYQLSCYDIASPKPTCVPGNFGWTTLDNNYIPYILRDGEKYCAGRMVSFLLCKKYPSGFHTKQTYDAAWRCQRAYTTNAEADLLNEINQWHCDLMFGPEVYMAGDFLLQLQDAAEFLKFFSIVYKCSKANIFQDDALDVCGFVVISGSNPIPYVVQNGVKFVPLFIFKFSVVDDKKALKLRAKELNGWDLTYLNFCYNVLKYPRELMNKDTCEVVNFDEVIRLYPTGTPYKFYWETAPRVVENTTSTSTAASPVMPVVHLPPLTSGMRREATTVAVSPPLTSTGTHSREKLKIEKIIGEKLMLLKNSSEPSQVAPVSHLPPVTSIKKKGAKSSVVSPPLKSTNTPLTNSWGKLMLLQENETSTAASQVAPVSHLPPFTSIKKKGAMTSVVSPPLKSTNTLLTNIREKFMLLTNSSAPSEVAPVSDLPPLTSIKKKGATSSVVSPPLKSTNTPITNIREKLTLLKNSSAPSQVAPVSELPPLPSIKKKGATSSVVSPPLKSTNTPLTNSWGKLMLFQENETSTTASQVAPVSRLPPFTSIRKRGATSSIVSPPLPSTDLQRQEVTSSGSQFEPAGPVNKRSRWDIKPECTVVENSGAQISDKMWAQPGGWSRCRPHNGSDESNGGLVPLSSLTQTSPLLLARDQLSQVLLPENSSTLAVSNMNEV